MSRESDSATRSRHACPMHRRARNVRANRSCEERETYDRVGAGECARCKKIRHSRPLGPITRNLRLEPTVFVTHRPAAERPAGLSDAQSIDPHPRRPYRSGVLLGRATDPHNVESRLLMSRAKSYPGAPSSGMVGTPGAVGERCAVLTASTFTRRAFACVAIDGIASIWPTATSSAVRSTRETTPRSPDAEQQPDLRARYQCSAQH